MSSLRREPFVGVTRSYARMHAALYAAAGALTGFVSQRLIGCRTGACVIQSSPWASTLYGALLGAMMGAQ